MQKERRERLARGLKIDYVGFLLVALGFGCLQVVLDRFERDDGFSSSFITSLRRRQRRVAGRRWWSGSCDHDQPVVNLRLLKIPAFAISNVVMFVFGFIIVSTTQLLPQLTQELLGYDAMTAGLTLGAGGLVTRVHHAARRRRHRAADPAEMAGAVGHARRRRGAMHYASSLDLNASFWTISTSRILQVFWLPLVFIPLSAVQFIGVPPAQNNDASAIINLMRNLGGSFGVSIVTTELAWRGQFHHARLAEHVTPYNGYGFGANLQAIGAAGAAAGDDPQLSGRVHHFELHHPGLRALRALPAQHQERRPRRWPLTTVCVPLRAEIPAPFSAL